MTKDHEWKMSWETPSRIKRHVDVPVGVFGSIAQFDANAAKFLEVASNSYYVSSMDAEIELMIDIGAKYKDTPVFQIIPHDSSPRIARLERENAELRSQVEDQGYRLDRLERLVEQQQQSAKFIGSSSGRLREFILQHTSGGRAIAHDSAMPMATRIIAGLQRGAATAVERPIDMGLLLKCYDVTEPSRLEMRLKGRPALLTTLAEAATAIRTFFPEGRLKLEIEDTGRIALHIPTTLDAEAATVQYELLRREWWRGHVAVDDKLSLALDFQ